MRLFFVIFFCALAFPGCAELNPLDAPKEIIENPLGTDPLQVGMSKEEVTSIWGNPDQINPLEPSDQWQMPREEWVYLGRYSKIPLNADYMFKTKYLVFDGNNLVCIGDQSQCKDVIKPLKEPVQTPVTKNE